MPQWLSILLAAGAIALAIERWVRGRERSESTERQARLVLRTKMEREHETLREHMRRMDAEIERLHEAASRFGTGMQTKVGDLTMTVAVLTQRINAVEREVQALRRYIGRMAGSGED